MSNVRLAARPSKVRDTGRGRLQRSVAIALVCVCAQLAPARVQSQSTVGGRNEVFAGSDLESYLRYLQTAGKSRDYPWSIRSFSPTEIDALAPADSAHPWAKRYNLQRRPYAGGFQWDYIRPKLNFYVNSAYPYGGADGPVWQGKGLTSSIQGGIAARWGPISATLAPVAFRAENQSFPLFRNGESGRLRFADGQFPFIVDLPQRFGTAAYTNADLGQSTLRFDWTGIALGISTANQWWGPTDVYPYILGNNAAGFPHVFFGTSRPANLLVAMLHARLIYGVLDQSAYSPVTGPQEFRSFSQPGTRRFAAGLIATLKPRGVPGLEIGGARFFHAAKDSSGFSSHNLRLPLENFLKNRLRPGPGPGIEGDFRSQRENQLASLFLRWAPPGGGFEVYGEYGREDHSADSRDLILEPDHSGTVNIGFRKAWLSPTVMQAVRAEVFNYEWPMGDRTRQEGSIYLHYILRQGHTNRGQLLGANVGLGTGGAQSLAYDRYMTSGRLTAFATRVVMHEVRSFYTTGREAIKPVDILNSVGIEAVRFVGPLDVVARVIFSDELNRNFIADQANANLALGIRQSF